MVDVFDGRGLRKSVDVPCSEYKQFIRDNNDAATVEVDAADLLGCQFLETVLIQVWDNHEGIALIGRCSLPGFRCGFLNHFGRRKRQFAAVEKSEDVGFVDHFL